MAQDFIQTVLFQLFMIIVLVEVAKMICNRVKVPTVIGEIMVGIVIANTFLYEFINLGSDTEVFEVLKELGVIFLLFTVGLETPFSTIRKVGKTAILVAVFGVILPFFVGYVLMVGLGYGTVEALFVGAAMVATSVGITARVIKDMNLMHAIESRVIIGAAVIDDILGMIVLAVVVGIAGGGALDIVQVGVVSFEAVLFVLAVIFIGSLLLPKVMKKRNEKKATQVCTAERRTRGISPLPLALIICFALSSVSSFLGLAAIIGAFLAGMAFAEFKDTWPCEEKIGPITEFLTPFFFVFVGISVSLAAFGDVLILAIIITLLAIVTKFVGCGIGAKKLGGKSAAIIGVGMVPRGEVGLIVASIGLSMSIVELGVYNTIVFMSLATTLVAPPLLTYTFQRKLGKKCELAPPDE
ncbi:MAG TPA: cation:proton antiporter [Methanomassiliicoccales archaeon]|nr:cation:proton antiporter [Methanomassiliicoccales archaeon]